MFVNGTCKCYKNLKIVLIFSFFASVVCSCLNDTEKRMCKNNNIWLFYEYDDKTDKYKITYYGYKFYKNGTYISMWYDCSGNKWLPYTMDDVVVDNHWNYDKKTNTMNIGGRKMKVIFFDKDTINLSNSMYGQDTSLCNELWINWGNVNPQKLKRFFHVDVNKKIRQKSN